MINIKKERNRICHASRWPTKQVVACWNNRCVPRGSESLGGFSVRKPRLLNLLTGADISSTGRALGTIFMCEPDSLKK